MMRSKNSILVLVAVFVLAISSVAAAAGSTDSFRVAALAAARAEVPAEAIYLGHETADEQSKFVFQSTDTYERYYVKVDSQTAKVREMDIRGAVFVLGSTTVNKTASDIQTIILENYPTAKNIIIKTERDNNNTYYEVEFTTEKYAAEAKLNPATGVFIEREFEYY